MARLPTAQIQQPQLRLRNPKVDTFRPCQHRPDTATRAQRQLRRTAWRYTGRTFQTEAAGCRTLSYVSVHRHRLAPLVPNWRGWQFHVPDTRSQMPTMPRLDCRYPGSRICSRRRKKTEGERESERGFRVRLVPSGNGTGIFTSTKYLRSLPPPKRRKCPEFNFR